MPPANVLCFPPRDDSACLIHAPEISWKSLIAPVATRILPAFAPIGYEAAPIVIQDYAAPATDACASNNNQNGWLRSVLNNTHSNICAVEAAPSLNSEIWHERQQWVASLYPAPKRRLSVRSCRPQEYREWQGRVDRRLLPPAAYNQTLNVREGSLLCL